MNKLIKKIIIDGDLITVTGLKIGAGKNTLSIGLPDAVVVRNPVDERPYIPGSSLKGKMRSLLEISKGFIGHDYLASNDPRHATTLLFGNALGNKDEKNHQRPSRLICRDAFLKNFEELSNLKTDLPYTEVKWEVAINRVTSEAHPRQIERVPAGSIFEFQFILNVFEGEKTKEELLNLLFEGMALLQDDYLGGSGSRGSGRIKFSNIKMREKTYGENPSEKEITEIPAQFK
jgi:CRISPR-associated protein Csm3